MDREALLEPIIASIRKGTSLSRPQILQELESWEVKPLDFEGRHVATLIVKGTEVHFALAPGWRPAGSHRGAVRAVLQPVFDRFGFLTTRVLHGRYAQKAFVQKLGFRPTWHDANVEYYLLGSMPFERKKS